MAFSQDHERICAIEWLVQHLAIAHCLKSSDPVAEAHRVAAEGEEYGDLLYAHASQGGNTDHAITALSIGRAITTLLEHLASDVQTVIDQRNIRSSG